MKCGYILQSLTSMGSSEFINHLYIFTWRWSRL